MRTLNIVCGIAVLLAALHLAHFIPHVYERALAEGFRGPAFLAGEAAGTVVVIFSLIGGVLLLRRDR